MKLKGDTCRRHEGATSNDHGRYNGITLRFSSFDSDINHVLTCLPKHTRGVPGRSDHVFFESDASRDASMVEHCNALSELLTGYEGPLQELDRHARSDPLVLVTCDPRYEKDGIVLTQAILSLARRYCANIQVSTWLFDDEEG